MESDYPHVAAQQAHAWAHALASSAADPRNPEIRIPFIDTRL